MAVTELEFLLQSRDATWNADRWEKLPNDGSRYEVIDGVLFMSTAPSHLHQRVVIRLVRHVGIPLEDAGLAIQLTAPVGVFMSGADPVQPDFCLIRSEREGILAEDGRVRGVPDLIAEILSPGNPELDTEIKLVAYARAGVPEYWIVRPRTRDVLLYSQPDVLTGTFLQSTLIPEHGILVSPTLPIRLTIADLF